MGRPRPIVSATEPPRPGVPGLQTWASRGSGVGKPYLVRRSGRSHQRRNLYSEGGSVGYRLCSARGRGFVMHLPPLGEGRRTTVRAGVHLLSRLTREPKNGEEAHE